MRRINMSRRGIVAAMEEEEIVAAAVADDRPAEPVVAIEPEVVVGDNANSVETDLIEIADASAEGDEQVADINEGVEIAEALESLSEALGVCAANGGLDKHAAKAVGIATGYMYGRLGIESKPMPALESFGGVSSRIDNTRIAMEEIKEGAKKAWEAIVAAFNRIIEWAKEFYAKIFTSYEKLGKRAEELVTKAGATKGEQKQKEFENDRLFKALAVNGKVGSDTDVANLSTILKSLVSANGVAEAEKIAGVFSSATSEEDFVGKFELESNKALVPDGSVVSNPESDGFVKPKDGLVLIRGKELLGGKALIGRVNEETLKGQAAIDSLGGATGRGVTIGAFNPKADDKTGKLSTLETGAAGKIATAVAEAAKEGIAYKSKNDAVTAAKKKLAEAAKKISSGEADVKSAKSVAGALAAVIDQPAASVSVYALSTLKSLLDYVEESLKQYGGEKAKEEAKPAEEKKDEKAEA